MDSIEEIKGIGKKTKELFNKLGIYTKNDLIHYYPYRYEILKRTNIKEIYTTNKIIIDGRKAAPSEKSTAPSVFSLIVKD